MSLKVLVNQILSEFGWLTIVPKGIAAREW